MSEAKKDCFGYGTINNRCMILTDTYCKKEECRFYKTKRQYNQEVNKYGKK